MSDLGTIQEAVDALDLDLDALNEQMTCLFDEIRMILLDPEPVSTEQAEVPLSAPSCRRCSADATASRRSPVWWPTCALGWRSDL